MREISLQEINNVSGAGLFTPTLGAAATTGQKIGSSIGGAIDNLYTKLTGHAAFNEAAAAGLFGSGIGSIVDAVKAQDNFTKLGYISTAFNNIEQGLNGIVSGIRQGFEAVFKK